jgi:drug/metabolite transporter (DMT)-like permease
LTKALGSHYKRAVLELIFAGAIWGSSFTLAKWALIDFSTSSLIFWRFLWAFLIGEILLLIFQRKVYLNTFSDFWISMPAGFSLGTAIVFQTHGLNFTTATNSSFITSLYVVMLPVASYFIFKSKLTWYHIGLSLLAFLGMGFLLNISTDQLVFNFGDIITIGAAIASTFHIIFVGIGSRKMKNAFRYNTFQTFWSLMIVIPFLIYQMDQKNVEFWPSIVSSKSLLSILGLSIFVSLGAFFLQIRAQKILSNTTASMLCLLEGPYSFIFASVFLAERLSPIQFLGAFIILLSSAMSVYIERPQDR